ncbi:MAG: PD40 domain-containing protein [Planctomycetes bacterium]|nr:PD40 domain-containing protein [Planctomycetota bacterium]
MLAKCPFVFLLAVAAVAQDRLTPESLWQLQRVGDLQLSPDGERLLHSVRSTDLAQNRGSSKLFLLAFDGRTPPVELGAGSMPAWIPGNVQGLVLADGKSLARVDPRTPTVRSDLALPAGFGNLKVSPSGTHIAYTRDVKIDPDLHDRHQDLPLANARAYDDLMVRHWDSWKDGTYSHLFVRALAGGPEIDLMAGEAADTPMKPFGGAEQFCWSPDGTMLCYTCKRVGDPEASTDSSLLLVSAEGGKAESITAGMPGFDQDPAWSPDGRYIAFGSMARGGFEADRMRLFVHDRQTKTNTELLPKFDASVHGLQWTLDSKQLFFTVETEGTTQVYRCTLADKQPIAVTRGRHQLDGIQVSPDANTVYALRATMERPAEVVRIEVATGAITALTDVNGAAYARLAVPSVEAEWFPATDGKKIHAWVVKPPDFDPARKWPMVLICQGGPQSMVGQGFSFRWNYHLMAAQGLRGGRGQPARIARIRPGLERPDLARLGRAGDAGPVVGHRRDAGAAMDRSRALRRGRRQFRRLHDLLADGPRRRSLRGDDRALWRVQPREHVPGDRGTVVRQLGPRRAVLELAGGAEGLRQVLAASRGRELEDAALGDPRRAGLPGAVRSGAAGVHRGAGPRCAEPAVDVP